jgi:microcystin-dependent protein
MSWIKIDDNLYCHDKAPYGLIRIDSNWEVFDLRDKSKFIDFSDIFNNPVFPIDFSNSDLIVKSLESLGNVKALHFRGELANSPTTPAFSSQGDIDTGFYHISSGKFGFSSNGIKTMEFDTDLTVLNKSNLMPVGTIIQSILETAPSGFLLCDGAEYLFSDYLDLFSALPIKTNTITFTIASPCVVTWNSHGLATGQSIQFSTTGTLPTFSVFQAVYYIRKIDSNTFHLYTTLSNAMNINSTTGRINTSGTQSGVHTAESYLYGNGDGSTTFNIPDLRGASPRGAGTSTGYIEPVILTLGEKTDDQFQSHRHTRNVNNRTEYPIEVPGSGNDTGGGSLGRNGYDTTGNSTTDTMTIPRTGTETRAKTQAVNFYIKY